jgi:hypothetical protein
MKVPYVLSLIAAIVFVALGVASVLLDFSIRGLRIEVSGQEGEVRAAEARNSNLAESMQVTAEKMEREEQGNQALRKVLLQRQAAVQAQQEQINQGTVIAQQIAPNLLHDMAEASVKNDKIKQILARHGYTVQPK